MKKSYKILFIVEILTIVITIALICLSAKFYYIIGILALETIILTKYFGIEKEDGIQNSNSMLTILITILAYYFITYILGLYIGFVTNSHILDFEHILKNILPILVFIFVSEILRYELITKGRKSKVIIYIATILIIILELAKNINGYQLENLEDIVKFMVGIVVPSIAKNIMLSYICYYSSYKAPIIYRVLIEIPSYIIPILPNLGVYVQATVEVILPSIIFYQKYKDNIEKEYKVTAREKDKTGIPYTIVLIILIAIILLTSGLFKYYAMAIGSGSMQPIINKGDAIVVEKLNDEEKKNIEIGQILVFKNGNTTIVHRVVQINKISEEEHIFYTKGDNNNSYDGYPVYMEDVIGISKFRIRFIGFPTVWLNEILNSR